jgi:hypothetical protein
LLAAAAGLLAWVAITPATEAVARRWWAALSILIVCLSIDEVATFHEWSSTLVDVFDDHIGGFFAFSWVLVGGAAAVVAVLVFGRFVLSRPEPLRRRIVLAAGLYLAGAVGMEMLGARIEESQTSDSFAYITEVVVEELLEMTAVLVLLRALLDHLADLGADIRVIVPSEEHQEAPPA